MSAGDYLPVEVARSILVLFCVLFAFFGIAWFFAVRRERAHARTGVPMAQGRSQVAYAWLFTSVSGFLVILGAYLLTEAHLPWSLAQEWRARAKGDDTSLLSRRASERLRKQATALFILAGTTTALAWLCAWRRSWTRFEDPGRNSGVIFYGVAATGSGLLFFILFYGHRVWADAPY